jgi:hypothetical protein
MLALHAGEHVEVGEALERGRGALELDAPAALYTASLAGDARVLGAWQRREDLRVTNAVRRMTGGPAVVAGDGIFYAALAMKSASTFMECPRDRVLNRNVRGFLAGLRTIGLAAHYFGREFVSVDRRPAAMIGWTRRPRGEVLIELFLGTTRSFAVPDEEQTITGERLLGKTPITIGARDPRILGRAIAGAFAQMGGLSIEERTIERAAIDEPAFDPRMRWSAPREVPIGWLHAGVTRDESGIVIDAALTGDFFQDSDARDRLRAALAGGHPTPERLRDALNATYGPHGAVIEGLRSLQPVLEAFLELA